MDLITISFGEYTIIYNLHNAKPCVRIPGSEEYTSNFNLEFPLKNWNEFNLFSIKNDKDNGTEEVEKLDKFEMINNCEGYW
mmetsp:Transcript_68245/g.147177  ORF Transcript_68245/g.147177 Transcript_68245/m.147177 type:complete len:81 (-) Transcript_68245:390-632(-)